MWRGTGETPLAATHPHPAGRFLMLPSFASRNLMPAPAKSALQFLPSSATSNRTRTHPLIFFWLFVYFVLDLFAHLPTADTAATYVYN